MFRLEHLKESGSNSRIRFGAAWQQAMSVMYKIQGTKIQSTKFRYKIGLYSAVHGSAVQHRVSRPSSGVQSRESYSIRSKWRATASCKPSGMLFFILRTEVAALVGVGATLPAIVLSWFQYPVVVLRCPQKQVAAVRPHLMAPAKPTSNISRRVLFQKCAGLWKKEPQKAQ